MDLIYFGEDYALRDVFKEKFVEAFPENKIEDAEDDIRGVRLLISYEPATKEEIMKWLIERGWERLSLNFNLMILDKEGCRKLKKWVEEIFVKES